VNFINLEFSVLLFFAISFSLFVLEKYRYQARLRKTFSSIPSHERTNIILYLDYSHASFKEIDAWLTQEICLPDKPLVILNAPEWFSQMNIP
jgi:hypothetical protein